MLTPKNCDFLQRKPWYPVSENKIVSTLISIWQEILVWNFSLYWYKEGYNYKMRILYFSLKYNSKNGIFFKKDYRCHRAAHVYYYPINHIFMKRSLTSAKVHFLCNLPKYGASYGAYINITLQSNSELAGFFFFFLFLVTQKIYTVSNKKRDLCAYGITYPHCWWWNLKRNWITSYT